MGEHMVIRLDIAEEHLHEAGFLHAVWEKDLRSPIFTLDEIAKGPERRLLAHLDGLVLGGPEVAQKLLLPAICGDDPDLVFAAALALLMGERSVDFEVVKVALEQAKRGTRPAICRALALAPSPDLGRKLAPLALSAPAIRADLLEVLGYLRLDPGLPLDPLFASGEPDQEALGLALARSFPSRLGQGFVEHAFTSPEPSVRAAALETGLVLRQRGVFEAAHQTF